LYKLFLILKYLRKRRIAWVSLIAVTLCTAMVLVVISVMGGWLNMFRQSFHGLSGDVVVESRALTGFPYYDEMIAKIEKLPEIEAACPVIKAYALLNIVGNSDEIEILGYPIDKIGKVNDFPKSLYRQYQEMIDKADDKTNSLTDAERAQLRRDAEESAKHPSFKLPLSCEDYKEILPKSRVDVCKLPGIICGAGILHIYKDKEGKIQNRDESNYTLWAKVTVLPIEKGEKIEEKPPSSQMYWVVDSSRTKVWQYDNKTAYVPFDLLQKDLGMDEIKDEDMPARTTEIHIKVKPGVNLRAAADNVEAIVNQVIDSHPLRGPYPRVQTWEEVNALWLGAVEKEKLLVTILFGLISVVAIFLIFCIFYMIVAEKTRDIGIIKAVGATSKGVAGVFLGYGLVIGVLGAALGLLASYGIVHNINFLHQELNNIFHVYVWDPEVYLFDTIPNQMNTTEVVVICAIAVLSSVLGALIPAIRAARMDPVESLRWE
jgi:lipoprotein-releasing system permease protein